MSKRYLSFLSIFLFLNTFVLPAELRAASLGSQSLDLGKINSSVDAGSFYSVDAGITQLEEDLAKMAQELKRLKQQVEFAKQAEQKRMAQIQKLERENAKLCQSWLDNSWTGSSARLENSVNANSGNIVESPKNEATLDATVSKTATEAEQPASGRQEVVVEVVGR